MRQRWTFHEERPDEEGVPLEAEAEAEAAAFSNLVSNLGLKSFDLFVLELQTCSASCALLSSGAGSDPCSRSSSSSSRNSSCSLRL